jgi:hypothetical protein
MNCPYGTRYQDGARLSGRAPFSNSAPTHASGATFVLPIRVQRPASGCIHPLRAKDFREWIEITGYAPFYGLKSIRLRHECGLHRTGLMFAEYIVPGEIHLYAVPASPWRLPFLLPDDDRKVFTRHGARIGINAGLRRTVVEWPNASLRDFYLIEVLAHELGHHLLQHNVSKRTAQVRRRGDHERFADLHSRRTYLNLQQSQEGR